GAIERRAREILERRQCDWLEAWTLATKEQEVLDDAARIADRAPGRHPAGHARHAPGRVTLSAQIGVAMPRSPGAGIPGRRPASPALSGPVMRRAERPEIDPEAAELLARARRGGEPLDGALRSRLEASLGTPLDGVRIHRDAEADAAARALGALAFALGD